MIIPKYGKSYDTADGTEQLHASSEPARGIDDQSQSDQWNDDGGPCVSPAIATAQIRPTWSVLSLRALNEAIQQTRDNVEAGSGRETADLERLRVRALLSQFDQREAVKRDRDRNAWEHAE